MYSNSSVWQHMTERGACFGLPTAILKSKADAVCLQMHKFSACLAKIERAGEMSVVKLEVRVCNDMNSGHLVNFGLPGEAGFFKQKCK